MATASKARAFWIVCDLGFAVGLETHKHKRMGSLVWIAEPVFDEEPTLEDVAAIRRWRWCTFFPLGAALRRQLVSEIGYIDPPAELSLWPDLRGSRGPHNWYLLRNGDLDRAIRKTEDKLLPPAYVVNDTRLKEMIVGGWSPAMMW